MTALERLFAGPPRARKLRREYYHVLEEAFHLGKHTNAWSESIALWSVIPDSHKDDTYVYCNCISTEARRAILQHYDEMLTLAKAMRKLTQ